MIPRSARTHSIRVLERIATRSSGCTPSPRSPAAIALARSATWDQVSQAGESASVGPGWPKARASGVALTRWRNMSGMDRYGSFEVVEASFVAGESGFVAAGTVIGHGAFRDPCDRGHGGVTAG